MANGLIGKALIWDEVSELGRAKTCTIEVNSVSLYIPKWQLYNYERDISVHVAG